jgi:cyclase
MLRHRVITVLTFNNGVLFRTKLFKPDYRYTLNFVDAWSVDEIVVLDVTRPGEGDSRNFEAIIKDFAQRCHVPLAAGGGIRSLDDAHRFIEYGADKVIVNTGALKRPELIGEIAQAYGSQCVVLSIDAKPDETTQGQYEVFAEFATKPTGRTAVSWAAEGQQRGAGEVLITAIERDGWLQGYDLELSRQVAEAVSVPVLLLGGCGNWKHMADGIKQGQASAVCTQNIYHFTETSIKSAKQYLNKAGIDVRLS